MLIQKRTVLELHQHQRTEDMRYFQYEGDGDAYRVGYYLPLSDFIEMGKPTKITVTVERGDTRTTGDLRDEGRRGEIDEVFLNVLRSTEDGGWEKAEPLGWQEEHDWLARAWYKITGRSHCGRKGWLK